MILSDENREQLLSELESQPNIELKNKDLPYIKSRLREIKNEKVSHRSRMNALLDLKSLMFHSPIYEDWRPIFFETLRSLIESDDQEIRYLALEILAINKDRFAQEEIVSSLRGERNQLISPQEALALLEHDAHIDISDVAEKLAESDDLEARIAALRVLAHYPKSKNILFRTLLNSQENFEIRLAAAQSLNALDRESLSSARSLVRRRVGRAARRRRGALRKAPAMSFGLTTDFNQEEVSHNDDPILNELDALLR